MGSGMFDGLITVLLTIGALIGAAAVGLVWVLVQFVLPHIIVGWR